ncbi:MAG TPA: hypothetical protein VHA82_13265 [Ramlibacter sp.]|uniref:hypothetical protein n=1 Tax=Ramlibacter sp. TaxID=1917967 RepID=UPI002CB9BC3B|nr:hypothetical protein [Ramlibacter sp.]HVZ44773.1 hypothetical protein [Ramlibacter sp.]
MAMQGRAALAMWWDMAPDHLAEFEHWHTHEHYPERLAIPGFRRASRWLDANGGEAVFQLYELAHSGVLTSQAYLERLNAPSPWSTRMMPHHRNMIRSQCKVIFSSGAVTARHALTVRLSPARGQAQALSKRLEPVLSELPMRAGLGGAHLLRHRAASIPLTTEQKIRGGDRHADWVLLVTGYDRSALDTLAEREFSEPAMRALGAAPGAESGRFELSYSATSADIATG